MVVYLHEVRGIPLETVGLLLALQAGVGIVLVTPAGALIDRIGPRRVYASSLVALLVADVVLALATTTGQAAVALVLMGYGFGIVWPASSALIGNLIPTEQRQRYFGINFTLLNLGIGIGGIVGGRFVDVSRPGTFVTIYLLDALSYVPALVHPARPAAPRPRPGRAARRRRAPAKVSYLALLRDPRLRALLLLVAVAALVSYPQLNAGMPAYARAEGQISTEGLGYAFAANTVVIVVLQLFVLQRIEGRAPHARHRRHGPHVDGGLVAARRDVARAGHRHGDGPALPRAPGSSVSARRCSSRRAPRWSTTSRPTTCAAATTRSAR